MQQLSANSIGGKLAGLLISLVLISLVAALGAWASVSAAEFYSQLQQPAWAPPAWVFGPAWTSLFLLMAIAAWLVWLKGSAQTQPLALRLYGVQLVFNVLWSWLFFAWHQGGLAFANILLLWLLILGTLVSFYRVSRWAGWLLVPYLGWVSFAACLNFSIWQLNPQLL